MNKIDAIDQAWRIATLTEPDGAVGEMLYGLEYERVLELLLILRQSPNTVKHPVGFVRRAIKECWKPETLPERVDRRAAAPAAQPANGPSWTGEAPAVSDEEFAEYVRMAEAMKASKNITR